MMTQSKTKHNQAAVSSVSVINGAGAIPHHAKGAVVALGNFDGVHRGHQAVITQAVTLAKNAKCKAAVMTFEPHPTTVFSGKEPAEFRLSNTQAKAKLVAALGADFIFEVPFDERLFTLSASEFVEQILLERFQVKGVVCGYDFVFGHKRSGDVSVLSALSKQYGFDFVAVDAIGEADAVVSSSSIRKALQAGDLEKANNMLGHAHLVRGEVQHGDKRGREIGFPTANILLKQTMLPAKGVYAGWVRIGEDAVRFPAVMNFGTRPTFQKQAELLEVHLLDRKDHQLYGKELWVELHAFIRSEKKFENVDALQKQIELDCKEAQMRLSGETL